MPASSPTIPLGAPERLAPPPIPDHEVLCLIGRGSYGEVWLARTATGSLRAVKVVYQATFEPVTRIDPLHVVAIEELPPRKRSTGKSSKK